MERYHIFKLGLAILFYAAYCIRPMLVNGLRSVSKSETKPEDYFVFYQVQDGTPGVDFPILSNIPRTAFSCQDIDSGYYADLETDCQVFHICEEGKKISFLCPNGTIFDQSDLICEWWFKVNCTNSPSLYPESAEILRESMARKKASRRVLLNGQEPSHGAVMRVEESSSISARKAGKSLKSLSPETPNSINGNGGKSFQSSGRAIDQQKPKRYNDADTGNYVNKVEGGQNLKEYHVQFSGTSPGLQTASSDRHVQVRSTTPSSLNSVSSGQGQNLFKNMANGSRGKIRFRPLETDEEKSNDEYDLEFPKHRSEIPANSPKSGPGIQAALIGNPNLSGGSRVSDSDELQVPQETAAFAKNSYNSLRTSAHKQQIANPYPNHRTTYSELKQPTLPPTRAFGGINSVTPQYITTQSISNGKPFIGSTVGVNVYGSKLRTSTFEPDTSPFGRHISSTVFPVTTQEVDSTSTTTDIPATHLFFISSTTSAPQLNDASSTTPRLSSTTTAPRISSTPSALSSFSLSSTTAEPLERRTKAPADRATVYGSFSKSFSTTPSPARGVEVKFGKNADKISIQLSKSVGGDTTKYSSSAKPQLLKSNSVLHLGSVSSSTPRSTVSPNIGKESTLPVIQDVYSSTAPVTEASTSGKPTVTTNYPSTTTNNAQTTTESDYRTSTLPESSTADKQSEITTARDNILHEGTTLRSDSSTRINLAPDTSSIAPEIKPEGGSGFLKSNGFDSTLRSTGIKSLIESTENPIDASKTNSGSTLRPYSLVPKDGSTTTLPNSDNSISINLKGTIGVSHGAGFIKPTSTFTSSKAKVALPDEPTTVSPDRGSTQEIFTERTELSTNPPFSTTGSFNTVTGRGQPFQSSISNDENEDVTSRNEVTNDQRSKTHRPPIYQITPRGSPFKSSVTTDSTTEPLVTVTRRGQPFASSQDPNDIPTSTLGITIYEVFTDQNHQYTTTTDQPTTTTIPSVNDVTHRGRPFITSEQETEVKPTEVFTESTTTKLPIIKVMLRGKPFKAVDSTADGSDYNASTEHLQTSTGQPDGTTVGEVTTSGNGSTLRIAQSDKQLEETTTTSESPKYGSAVNPPLLTSDAFIHVSDIQSTSRPSEGSPNRLESSTDNGDSQSTTLSDEETAFFSGSTAAPLTGTIRTYSSSVVPPLLSKDSIIHVSDVEIPSRPTVTGFVGNQATVSDNIFGEKIRPTEESFSSVPLLRLPQKRPHVEDVSKYGGFDINVDGSKTLPGSVKGRIPTVDVSQNTISSTLTPDIGSFGGSITPKPFIVLHHPSINLQGGNVGGGGNTGSYVTKNSVYDSPTSTPRGFSSSTLSYEQSTPVVNISPHSGELNILAPQTTLSAPKVESSFEKEVPLVKSESQWPRPFQRLNSLENKERATYLPTDSTTFTYVTYKISSARPFMLPEGTPAPTVPTPFTAATPTQRSVYENVDNMINILNEIVNATDQDYSSETPRPGLVVPPSVGPQTLHTLAVYFANALDGIAAEREKLTGEELDEASKEKLTSLLTQMTMYRYKELFKGKEDADDEVTTVSTEAEDDGDNLIQTPGLRQLARNFSLALSSYLDDPETFRKDLESLRPTEPPQLGEDVTEISVGDEELLNFSDADAKPKFPAAFPTLPSVTPTWGYIIAKGSEDSDIRNSLNPDLHTSDTQSFVPGFNNLPVSKGFSKASKTGLPEDHWTDSPDATKLWQTAFSVNPAIVNDHFVTTEPSLSETESTESYIPEQDSLTRLDVPQSEVRYDLRALPKVSVNATEVRGLLIDFINTTKDDEPNRLQRLLRKLNTTENEFLDKMKEIESNPLTRRLVLLLISECGTNATREISQQAQGDLSKEALVASQSSSSIASYNEGRPNSGIPELVDPNLQEGDQDTRALQLLNSLYTIAAKFGK